MSEAPKAAVARDRAAVALAAGGPLLAYLLGGSPHGYWLDGWEIVAASLTLGIGHPPGQPPTMLLGKAVSLLPLGPLALRIALGQAIAAALAAGFLYRAIDRTLALQGVPKAAARPPLALGGTWLAAGSYAWAFQAVRPEVYALQALLMCIAIERVTALQQRWRDEGVADAQPAYAAALCVGLGLANHHVIALLTLPGLAAAAGPVLRRNVPRRIGWMAAAVLTGAIVFAYLPLRATTGPLPNLGDPRTPQRLWWVISGQVYLPGSGLAAQQPLADRLADALVLFVEQLHAPTLLLALAGAYALLRLGATRGLGAMWILLLAAHVVGRAWLGPVRSNPDVLGYLLPAFAAASVLAASFVGAVLRASPARATTPVAALAAALALVHAATGTHAASLADFDATDRFTERRHRQLPPRAVIIAHLPQTVFTHWGAEVTERLRPDISLLAVPFLNYPGGGAPRDPSLAPLAQRRARTTARHREALQAVARQRPVRLEMDVRVDPALYAILEPDGLLHGVLQTPLRAATAERAAHAQRAMYRHLGRALDLDEPETRNQLLWRHYTDALYYAGVGAIEAARQSTARARRIAPRAPQLQRLAAALDRQPAGRPLGVRPFLVGPQGPPAGAAGSSPK